MESIATVYLQHTNKHTEQGHRRVCFDTFICSPFFIYIYVILFSLNHIRLLLQPTKTPVRTHQSQDWTHEHINYWICDPCSSMYVCICVLHVGNKWEGKKVKCVCTNTKKQLYFFSHIYKKLNYSRHGFNRWKQELSHFSFCTNFTNVVTENLDVNLGVSGQMCDPLIHASRESPLKIHICVITNASPVMTPRCTSQYFDVRGLRILQHRQMPHVEIVIMAIGSYQHTTIHSWEDVCN